MQQQARQPHQAPKHSTLKPPERCPHCNSSRLTTKGKRTRKLDVSTLYRCKACGRVFTPGPRAIRNKTYPLPEILDALTTYNLGYSLADTCRRLSSRYGHLIHPSTLSRWLSEHPALTTYRRLRARAASRYRPAQLIRTTKLYHRQVYGFAYHRGKLDFVCEGTIDDKREGDTRFKSVADFLERVPTDCPHDLFTCDDTVRGSKLADGFINRGRLVVTEKQNAATDMAALIIPSVGSNVERHSRLQRFMLVNDSTTIAVEVPVWLAEEDIAALERAHGITLIPREPLYPDRPNGPHRPRHVTGHIDFLQVRNGALHILDYKPDARTNKPFAQLTVYALALTRLVPGLRLFDIKCAWFNESSYNEFYPRPLLTPAND